MITSIIGSLLGTLIGLVGSLYIADYMLAQNMKKLKKLIEDANTFKITLKNEI